MKYDISTLKREHSLTQRQVKLIRELMHISPDVTKKLPVKFFGYRVSVFLEGAIRELTEYVVHPRKRGDEDYLEYTEFLDYCMLQILGQVSPRKEC